MNHLVFKAYSRLADLAPAPDVLRPVGRQHCGVNQQGEKGHSMNTKPHAAGRIHRVKIAALAIAPALVVGLAPPALSRQEVPASPDAPDVEFAGCRLTDNSVFDRAERLAPYAGGHPVYEFPAPGGLAWASFWTLSCDDMRLSGEHNDQAVPGVITLAGVVIQDDRPADGGQNYDDHYATAIFTDRPALAHRLAAAGLPAHHIDGLEYVHQDCAPVDAGTESCLMPPPRPWAKTNVPWSEGAFSVAANADVPDRGTGHVHDQSWVYNRTDGGRAEFRWTLGGDHDLLHDSLCIESPDCSIIRTRTGTPVHDLLGELCLPVSDTECERRAHSEAIDHRRFEGGAGYISSPTHHQSTSTPASNH